MSTTPRKAAKAPSKATRRAYARITKALTKAFATKLDAHCPEHSTVMDMFTEKIDMDPSTTGGISNAERALMKGQDLAKLLHSCAHDKEMAIRKASKLGVLKMFFVTVGVYEYELIPEWALSEAIRYREDDLSKATHFPSLNTIWQMVRYGIDFEHGAAGAALGLGQAAV